MILSITLFIVSLAILIKLSDIFVTASSSLSMHLKMPKMLIALTVAGFGTCAPELAISFNSFSSGNVDLTLANVIGSCIVNILLIIGLSSIIKPIKVKDITIKKELPLLVIISFAFYILLTDSIFVKGSNLTLSRADALMLICWFILFMFYIIGIVRKNKSDYKEEPAYSLTKSIILIILTIIGIVLSSDIVVEEAIKLASILGISEKIISMTIIVIGTSLPELTLTITSAKKSEYDMAIGNIIGTNIFNICIVLGLPTLIYGTVESSSFTIIDTTIVLLSSIIFYIFGKSNKELSKREGICMLLLFIIYYIYLFIGGIYV